MRFSKKIVVVMFATVFVFVGIMIATYWFKGGVPDSLIEQFFRVLRHRGRRTCHY